MTGWIVSAVLLVALAACWRWRRAPAPPRRPGAPPRVTARLARFPTIGKEAAAFVQRLENHTLADCVAYLKKHGRRRPALYQLLDLYEVERRFPDLGDFRFGPNMFEKILLDWIIFTDAAGRELIGHGVTTRIAWDQDPDHLPGGWQGAVRASYEHAQAGGRPADTLVGLFILVRDAYRQQGWANEIIVEMRRLGRDLRAASLIIPLRPPSRYEKELAALPLRAFAARRRADGLPEDHWIRLHVRQGARVIGVAETSHQHAMSLADFHAQFTCPPVTRAGDVLAQQRDGGWVTAYADPAHDFVLINQGCVWVQHPLDGDTPAGDAA